MALNNAFPGGLEQKECIDLLQTANSHKMRCSALVYVQLHKLEVKNVCSMYDLLTLPQGSVPSNIYPRLWGHGRWPKRELFRLETDRNRYHWSYKVLFLHTLEKTC